MIVAALIKGHTKQSLFTSSRALMASNSTSVFITEKPMENLEIGRNAILVVGSIFIAILLFTIVRELLTFKRTTSLKTKISIRMCKEMDTSDCSAEYVRELDNIDFARNNILPEEQIPSDEPVYHDVNEFSETRHLRESVHHSQVYEERHHLRNLNIIA